MWMSFLQRHTPATSQTFTTVMKVTFFELEIVILWLIIVPPHPSTPTLFSSHIIFYLHLLISIGRKPSIDYMYDLVDPSKQFGPLQVPCGVVSLSGPPHSHIWSAADHYRTRLPSHTVRLNFDSVRVLNKQETGRETEWSESAFICACVCVSVGVFEGDRMKQEPESPRVVNLIVF